MLWSHRSFLEFKICCALLVTAPALASVLLSQLSWNLDTSSLARANMPNSPPRPGAVFYAHVGDGSGPLLRSSPLDLLSCAQLSPLEDDCAEPRRPSAPVTGSSPDEEELAAGCSEL